ncbi:E3 ubiquitin-protein ligase rnf8-B-like isoform X2 [Daktulosphaira vitifoliae]|uniref:E3 ubiquitin-protein ligase rnf8-B-like isoform X2 n=1 Tax=Daktulosphaira vitifoliae TaxID=58002 RepID=UPI0021AA0DA4|nr:E3 ubiquitin-protein ligase rnf8-B-like isoform X2 [Daktulosphaira vitifoliae]
MNSFVSLITIIAILVVLIKGDSENCYVCEIAISDVYVIPCRHDLCSSCANRLKNGNSSCKCEKGIKTIVQRTPESILKKNDVEEDCGICMTKEADVMIVPCGHFFCGHCIVELHNRHFQCPVCRSDMESYKGLDAEQTQQLLIFNNDENNFDDTFDRSSVTNDEVLSSMTRVYLEQLRLRSSSESNDSYSIEQITELFQDAVLEIHGSESVEFSSSGSNEFSSSDNEIIQALEMNNNETVDFSSPESTDFFPYENNTSPGR